MILFSFSLHSQQTIGEKLGYSKDDILLIVHADDLGMSQAQNQGSINGFEKGLISSASIMVPCPWYEQIAEYAAAHPEHDWGLHITMNAEWKYMRWDGVSPSSEIPSLINQHGYLHKEISEVQEGAKIEELDKEIRAQIDKALKSGIKVTHLDSHMGTLFYKPEFLKALIQAGKDYGIPVMLPTYLIPGSAQILADTWPGLVPIERLIDITPQVKPEGWADAYDEMIDNLKPGFNQLIIHLAYDGPEMQALCIDHSDWGAEWRQRDVDYIFSERFTKALKRNNIKLVDWGEVQEMLMK